MGDRCNTTLIGRFFLKPLCPFVKPVFGKAFRIKVFGKENVPLSGGYIVASNHRSHLDPPVLNFSFPEPLLFLAKEELFKPPLGWLLRHARAVPLKRSSRDIELLETIVKIVRDGCPICIFPEGTRARPGEFLRPKPGVGLLAVKSGVPVVPVYIDGSDIVFPRGAKFPIPRSPIRVFIGRPMTFNDREETPGEYRRVSFEIMEAIKELSRARI